MAAEHKRYNRVRCTDGISAMMDKFYEDILSAPSQGRKVCWCSGASPFYPSTGGKECLLLTQMW